MEIDKKLLLESFQTETGDGLEQMEECLLELEMHPDDAELVNTIFRVVHTFKGNARIFELHHAQEFAHVLEDLLDRVRMHDLSLSPEIVDLLLASIDVLREFTAGAIAGKDVLPPKSKKILHRMKRHLDANPPVKHQARQDFPEMPIDPAPESSSAAANLFSAPRSARTLRVDVQKLDRLLDLTGEIAIARGRITRLLEDRAQVQFSIQDLAAAHSAADALQSELQELVMKVRMVPVGPLFRQYQRTVRDLARELGKTVELQIEGSDVEVDTSVVEHLRDPLLHMVRNAMDHGIELPDQRRTAGKPPAGTIILRASHRSGNISVEVEDDGAGLDRKKIVGAAEKRGLTVDPGRSDHEVYQWVFESGLSTNRLVSNLSGRGVGMDVVRRNVQALRGSASVSSTPGMGTTVQLRFPLTLAIIDGFTVGVGEESYVISVDQVLECVDLPVQARDSEYGDGVIELRGEPVPYLHLRDHFQLPGTRASRQNVVIVQHGAKRAGLAVDALYGSTQTVIKPLPHLFRNVSGVSGSAILGNGRVALILDVPALLRNFETEAAMSG